MGCGAVRQRGSEGGMAHRVQSENVWLRSPLCRMVPALAALFPHHAQTRSFTARAAGTLISARCVVSRMFGTEAAQQGPEAQLLG